MNEITKLGGNAAKAVAGYIERIERLEEEKSAIASDVKEVYKEARSGGFDAKILRRAISERKRASKMSEADWENEQNLLDMYLNCSK